MNIGTLALVGNSATLRQSRTSGSSKTRGITPSVCIDNAHTSYFHDFAHSWNATVTNKLRSQLGISRSGFFYPDPDPSPIIFSICRYRVVIRYSAISDIFLDNTAALRKKVPASKLFLNRFFYLVETKYILSRGSFLLCICYWTLASTFLVSAGECVTLHCDSIPSCAASWSVCETLYSAIQKPTKPLERKYSCSLQWRW